MARIRRYRVIDSRSWMDDNKKWDSFEPYKGPPDKKIPSWMDCLCKSFFSLLGLCITFSISGSLLWILPYRLRALSSLVIREEPWKAWARFILGGIIGVALIIRWWRRPIFDNNIDKCSKDWMVRIGFKYHCEIYHELSQVRFDHQQPPVWSLWRLRRFTPQGFTIYGWAKTQDRDSNPRRGRKTQWINVNHLDRWWDWTLKAERMLL